MEGDLSGGDRSGLLRFAIGHDSDCPNRTFVMHGSDSCCIWLSLIMRWSLKRRSSSWCRMSGILCGNRSHLRGGWRIFRFVSPGFSKLTRPPRSAKLFWRLISFRLMHAFGVMIISLFWPAMSKDFKAEIKAVVRLSISASLAPVRWLQEIPVFKSVLGYETLFSPTLLVVTA